MNIDTCKRMNNGVEIPILGLGTYQAHRGQECQEAVLYALELGYRHLDTAKLYGNEEDVGIAINRSGLPREEIFVTTKLWNSDHGYNKTLHAFDESLAKLGFSYVDLYLVHWPVPDLRLDTWKAMEKLLEKGKCHAVGVSNYMTWHLDELLKECSVVPAVNQVEFSPYLYLQELQTFCSINNILLETYSPLTKGQKLDDPKLLEIAKKYKKTSAQILIRWALQRNVVVIPKSSNRSRIRENADVFDFTILIEDMIALDSFHENLRTSWDPTTVP